MKYAQTTGRSIQADFDAYHQKYPDVYNYFKKYLREIYESQTARGIKKEEIKTSSKMILNRIRWEIETVGILNTSSEKSANKGVYDGFKINDAFTSRYARLFCDEYPDYAGLFNFRGLRS